MRNGLIFLILILSSCGGSLSDEQRKKIREGMEEQKIVRVTDAEITAEGMDKGRAVLAKLQQADSALIPTIAREQKVIVRFLTPENTNARAIEQELIEAYISGMVTGEGAGENIQKIWTGDDRKDYDSLLFSKPQTRMNANGVEELQGIWNIYMARKDLVLQIARNR